MSARRRAGGWLRLVSRLVPRERRDAWLREWGAERAHRRRAGRAGPLDGIAALEDAVALRLRTFVGPSILQDLRLSVRALLRRPAFSAVVVLTLALAVAANTAVFSLVRGALLSPLPYDRPDELALVRISFVHEGQARALSASEPEFFELQEQAAAFQGLSAFYLSDVNLGGIDEPLRVPGALVTAGTLELLGVRPSLGRAFFEGEDRPGAEDVVILTHGLWERAFAADPAVLGTTVLVNSAPYTVVGVLPPAFEFPGADVALLRTLTLDPADPGGRSSHWLSLVGRLRPGLHVEEAQAELAALQARWQEERPGLHQLGGDHPAELVGLRRAVAGDVRAPLLLLMGAVSVILLVACVNVANLSMVRAEARSRELGVRVALGAGRAVLGRQLLVESLTLAMAGGALGTALAAVLVESLPGLAADLLPPGVAPTLDPSVLTFSLAVTVGAGVLFGVAPAWAAARTDVTHQLRESTRGQSGGRRRLFLRRLLVAGEVAAAVTLVAAAGVLGRSLAQLASVDVGLDAEGVVVMDFALSSAAYAGAEEVADFHRELVSRVEGLPGVRAAGAIRSLPLRGAGGWETMRLVDQTGSPEETSATAAYQVASPGYFEAVRIPVVEGRGLDDRDRSDAPPVAVMSETAARQFFPGERAVGQRVQLGAFEGSPNPVMTIVGVVGDVRQASLEEEPPPTLYVPRQQARAVYGGLGTRFATLVVRAETDPGSTLAAVRAVVREMDPDLPVADAGTLEAHVARSMGGRRFVAVMMGAFSLVTLLLGAVGLYGLLAYVVAGRAREIGIRMALGARPGGVLGRVVGEATALVVAGSVLGLGVTLLASDALEGLVYGVGVRDPLMLAGAPLLLVLVGAAAALLPARRAASVDPAEALREE